MFAKSLLFCSALVASSAKSGFDAVMAAAPSEAMKGVLREHSRSLLATSCEYDGSSFDNYEGKQYKAVDNKKAAYTLSICEPLGGSGACSSAGISGACMCQIPSDNPTQEVVIASWTAGKLPTWEKSKDGNPQLKFTNGVVCYKKDGNKEDRTFLLEFLPGGTAGEYSVVENAGCEFVAKFSTGGGLSDGSIILIALLVSLILYCVIGMIWNKKKRGATGKELIPNYDFWSGLPGLVKDGGKYFVQRLTNCKGGGKTGNYDSI